MLSKERPTARDIATIEQAIDNAPHNMKRLLESRECKRSPMRKAYFEAKFSTFDDVALMYLRKARERAFPGGQVIMEAWHNEPSFSKRHKELDKTVKFLVNSAKDCEDRNSMAALRYIRDEVQQVYKGKRSDKGQELTAKIDQCLKALDEIEPSQWESKPTRELEVAAQKDLEAVKTSMKSQSTSPPDRDYV